MDKSKLSFFDFLKPPRAYCWQTLLWLSFFSMVMSYLATGFFQDFIAFLGQVFIVISITWLGKIYLFPLTSWLSAALFIGLIYGVFPISEHLALLLWLPLAAIFESLKYFISKDLNFKIATPKERSLIIILLISQMLIACWIQFYFVIQNWLQDYPSLQIDNFQNSNFVTKVAFYNPRPRSVLILDHLKEELIKTLDGQPWTQIENWLDSAPQNIEKIYKSSHPDILPEDQFWKLYFLDPLQESPWKIYTFIRHPDYQNSRNYTVQNLPLNDPWNSYLQGFQEENEYLLAFRMEWTGPQSFEKDENSPYRRLLACRIWLIPETPQQAQVTCDPSSR